MWSDFIEGIKLHSVEHCSFVMTSIRSLKSFESKAIFSPKMLTKIYGSNWDCFKKISNLMHLKELKPRGSQVENLGNISIKFANCAERNNGRIR